MKVHKNKVQMVVRWKHSNRSEVSDGIEECSWSEGCRHTQCLGQVSIPRVGGYCLASLIEANVPLKYRRDGYDLPEKEDKGVSGEEAEKQEEQLEGST